LDVITARSEKMKLEMVCCFVLLNQHWGIVKVPRFPRKPDKGARTHDLESPTYLLTLSSLRQPGVAGCSTFTLTTSLAIPVPFSSFSNGPTPTTLRTRGFCPGGSVVWASHWNAIQNQTGIKKLLFKVAFQIFRWKETQNSVFLIPSRISFYIPMTISSLIFSRTGGTCFLKICTLADYIVMLQDVTELCHYCDEVGKPGKLMAEMDFRWERALQSWASAKHRPSG